MCQLAVIHTSLPSPVVQVFSDRKMVVQEKFGRMLDHQEIEDMRHDPVAFLTPIREAAEAAQQAGKLGTIALAEFQDQQQGIDRDH